MKIKYFIIMCCICGLVSCDPKPVNLGNVEAFVPIYESAVTAKLIRQTAPQPFVNTGKIASIGQYVFQVEDSRGIHVIDKSDPANPKKLSFIKIPLCHELTLRGNFLYTNNISDLVVLNIANIANITVASRTSNAFPDLSVQFPNATNIYIECPDPSKGIVTDWEKKTVNNPKCYR